MEWIWWEVYKVKESYYLVTLLFSWKDETNENKNILRVIKLLEEWEDLTNGTGIPVYSNLCKEVLSPTWEHEILDKTQNINAIV